MVLRRNAQKLAKQTNLRQIQSLIISALGLEVVLSDFTSSSLIEHNRVELSFLNLKVSGLKREINKSHGNRLRCVFFPLECKVEELVSGVRLKKELERSNLLFKELLHHRVLDLELSLHEEMGFL